MTMPASLNCLFDSLGSGFHVQLEYQCCLTGVDKCLQHRVGHSPDFGHPGEGKGAHPVWGDQGMSGESGQCCIINQAVQISPETVVFFLLFCLFYLAMLTIVWSITCLSDIAVY